MRKGSIALSLLWLTVGWLVVALVTTGFLLSDLYARALDTALTETVDFQLESLVGALLKTGDPLSEEIVLTDGRFERPRSGWYWIVRDADGALYNLSASVVGINLPEVDSAADGNGRRSAVLDDPFGTRIRMVERVVTIAAATYRIVVTGNLSAVLAQVGDFQEQAFIVLGMVGMMLAIMSFIVARLAMRPVTRLSTAIENVREGDSAVINGKYPIEIAPLAEEVNALLRSNAQIIERARNQVGNLAHGLKTPVAVLRNEAAARGGALADVVLTETGKMDVMISTYLDRARLAARTAIVGKKADAGQVIQRLVRVMEKIHRDVTVKIKNPDQDLPWFRGDAADLEEMAGNLLDNACKWSRGLVEVQLRRERGNTGMMLLVRIDDNGVGLSAEDAQKVLRRGVRIDEKTPGSGLGLDIVKELVEVYGGSLAFARSALGGLSVELRLPMARPGGGSVT